ncbi:hypothetical protein HXX76_010008 [Chlamydomonas incerta]|uniref:Rieske domain-containing protein n=1 Tax=Chlamydomonas incerta TaxID=51695 RepID=A0A835T116_CHLIN|nr:hypothetical protein HXX76_010008 [Chlamydomonas incerta]|eukprot:KAG2430485.1 hypothetical protein HXX76_010008 [Chlamydomonas incerta]
MPPQHHLAPAGAAPPLSRKAPGPLRNPWGQQEGLRARYPRLEQDVSADVVVVGAGLSGLCTAYRLLRAGKSVVVLEARVVGSGSSGRGLGVITPWIDDTYLEVERTLGLEAARSVAASHRAAADFVRRLVAEEGIQCGLQEVEAAVAARLSPSPAAAHAQQPYTAGQQRQAQEGADAGVGTGVAGDGGAQLSAYQQQQLAWQRRQEERQARREEDRAARALREELAACCRADVEGGHVGLRRRAGGEADEVLLLPGGLNLHPQQLLAGLAEAVTRRGGRIYENSRAKGGKVTGPAGGRVQLLDAPHTATATQAVVLATHSPINRNQLWVHDRQLPKRSYTLGISVGVIERGAAAAAAWDCWGGVGGGWVPKGSVPAHFRQFVALAPPRGGSGVLGALLAAAAAAATGSAQKQQVSVRLAPLPAGHHMVQGEGGGGAASGASIESNKELLLVHGALHHHGHDEKQYGDPWGELEAWARERFPMSGRTLYCWTGSDYYPADLLGLYGRDPLDLSRPPVYVLTGHGGQEWTGAVLGSEAVAGAICGAPPPWAPAYRPSRFVPGALAKYTSELALYFATVAVSLLKHVLPRSLEDVAGLVAPGAVEERLEPGQGRVVQQGLLKVALYRDGRGQLHRHSALCTHLGCCVEWNPLDSTFDCPCHGSQYDACGGCLHGPAVADLEDLGGPLAAAATGRPLQALKGLRSSPPAKDAGGGGGGAATGGI